MMRNHAISLVPMHRTDEFSEQSVEAERPRMKDAQDKREEKDLETEREMDGR